MCIGIVFQYAVFPCAVDRCKCSVLCFIPGLYEALLALSINFHNVVFTHKGQTFSHLCITSVIHSGRVEVREGKLCFHLSFP